MYIISDRRDVTGVKYNDCITHPHPTLPPKSTENEAQEREKITKDKTWDKTAELQTRD